MKLTVREMVLFPLLGSLMFVSKLVTEGIPNVHLLAMFTIAFTVVYRAKALFPIFIFIMLTGLYYGFGVWWLPYFYLWPILWGMAMLLPRNMPTKLSIIVYMLVAAAHGFAYGTLYAPFQAVVFGLDFNGMLAWIVAGLPWDLVHGIGNFAAASLTVPTIKLLRRASKIHT